MTAAKETEQSVTIRDARLSDYGELCRVFAACNDLHCDLRPDYYQQVRPVVSKKDFLLAVLVRNFEFGRNRVTAKIAEKDGQTIGAVFAYSVKRRALGWSKFPKEAYIDNIAVDPEYRRSGVGTKLLRAVKDWAIASDHKYWYGKIANLNESSKAFFEDAGVPVTDVIVGGPLETPKAS